MHYADGAVHLALSGRGALLLDGNWQAAVSVDGCNLEGRGNWEAICWNADEDGDYLELQLPLEGGARIDRQLLLPRNGHLAFFADSILAPHSDRITYRARWPMAAGLRLQPETKSRAVRVRGAQTAARIFPLALPAERIRSTSDQLSFDASALELIQHGRGSALYAPLVFDWSPKRRGLPAFWRGLTVSERSLPLPADVAVGYRLQVGTAQWLVYHSLQNSDEARAVLGHHTWNETVIGAFRRDGTVDPLILIE
ncbi:MAG TPA: hypothetical protein VL475_11440 [Planctomycetaceae bacterium]|nr:hypothetical protein [Planctomycetaceae bacterium]